MNSGGAAGDEVGSLAEEAAKLIGALSDWAHEHTDGPDFSAESGHTDECTWCPVCRGIRFVRTASPEVKEHLATAASSLLQVAAGLLATHLPDDTGSDRRTSSVEHIDLDDTGEWPDREGEEQP